jgi:hypothetical protein
MNRNDSATFCAFKPACLNIISSFDNTFARAWNVRSSSVRSPVGAACAPGSRIGRAALVKSERPRMEKRIRTRVEAMIMVMDEKVEIMLGV